MKAWTLRTAMARTRIAISTTCVSTTTSIPTIKAHLAERGNGIGRKRHKPEWPTGLAVITVRFDAPRGLSRDLLFLRCRPESLTSSGWAAAKTGTTAGHPFGGRTRWETQR